MLKKIMPTLAICLMLMIFGGCACGETGMMATPAPTMQPTTTPETSPETSAMPDMASPNPTIGVPGTENGTDGNMDSGLSAIIPDFMEGTDVQATDVPEITRAIQEKYPNGEIVSIRHAMMTEQQVYAVVVKTSGTEKTVYVQPDGTVLEEGAGNTAQQ